MAKDCQASNAEVNQARAARAARAANQTSVNELASAETASTAGAAAASQEPTIALNPYAPAWTSDALNCISKQAGIYTLSDAGRDDQARPAVAELVNGQWTSNTGQRFQVRATKYEPGKKRKNSFKIVNALFDSGNTTILGLAISQQLASQLNLKIVPCPHPVRNVDGGVCAIIGTVAPQNLTIAFITSENMSKVFEVQPLVLRNMPDHINIGIRFMRQLQLKIDYDDVMDTIWAPVLGHLTQNPLASARPV